MEQKWATWVEAVRNQSVLSLAVIEQRGISEPGLGGKRTLVSTFFKERIPQTDRDCIAGIAYVRSTVHAGEHIKQRILFRAEANITRLGKKSEGILASKAYRMRASTILNLSCEHLSKAHGGRGDVSKLQCCWYYKDMIMWLRLLEGTLRSPLCMRPPPLRVRLGNILDHKNEEAMVGCFVFHPIISNVCIFLCTCSTVLSVSFSLRSYRFLFSVLFLHVSWPH